MKPTGSLPSGDGVPFIGFLEQRVAVRALLQGPPGATPAGTVPAKALERTVPWLPDHRPIANREVDS